MAVEQGTERSHELRRKWSPTAWMKVPELVLGYVADRKLSHAGFLVYCLLLRYRNKRRQDAYPSLRTMAGILHIGLSSVERGLIELERLKLVSVERRQDPAGDAARHVYTLPDVTVPPLKTGEGGVPQ